MVPIAKPADIMDPNIVKVVLDFDDNALYFSRAPIPWVRDREAPVHVQHMKHLGLYAFDAPRCSIFQRFRWETWSASNNSNSFAGWKTATRFEWPKRTTIRLAWMWPKTLRASKGFCANRNRLETVGRI